MVSRQHDVRPLKPTAWGKAAANILRISGIDQKTVADDLGKDKAYINRFLTGQRRPSQDNVVRINRSITKCVASSPGGFIESYLAFQALRSGLLSESPDDVDALIKGMIVVLFYYRRFFTDEALDRIADFLDAHDEQTARKLVLDLNQAFHRIVLGDIMPGAKHFGFSTIYEIMKRSGLDMESLISDQAAGELVIEGLIWMVRRSLVLANIGAGERFLCERRIFDALFDRRVVEALSERLANGQHPLKGRHP